MFNVLTKLSRTTNFTSLRMLSTRKVSSTMTTTNTVRLGVCQLMVGDNKDINLSNAEKMISSVNKLSPDIIVLPEIFNSPYSTSSFPVYCEVIPQVNTSYNQIIKASDELLNSKLVYNNKIITMKSSLLLSKLAHDNNVYIIGGSIPELCDNKLYNTCCIFDNKGTIIGKHRKIHLFDINIPNKIKFLESETLSGGNNFTVVKVNLLHKNRNIEFNVGIGICYDLRFSELADIYRQLDCKLIVYPGAFNTTTGPLHWELLQRGRALDNQLFICTCSPARNNDSSGYPTYGYSMVIDPWGKILHSLDEKENYFTQDINLDEVKQVREQIPILKQKRYDLYKAVSKL